MPSESQFIERLAAAADRMARAAALSSLWNRQILAEAEEAYHQQMNKAAAGYAEAVASNRQSIKEIEAEAGLSAAPWEAEAWLRYEPLVDAPIRRYTRAGILTMRDPWDVFQGPALVPIIGDKNVIIAATGAARAQANLALQALMLRLLATIPPGKLRFTLIDPVDRGRNMAGFMHLADYMESLVGGQVWTEPAHIQARLEDVTTHMDMVIQKYLRNQYPNIETYNAEAGEVEEPYRLVVVANFPAGFTTESANRLISIARSGPGCGVYLLMSMDSAGTLPYGVNLPNLLSEAHVIFEQNGNFIWQRQGLTNFPLIFDGLPSAQIFDRIVHKVGGAALASSDVRVPFRRLSSEQGDWWSASAARELRVPLGRAGARRNQSLVLGAGTAQHALVVGKTGSGKSTLFHVLITGIALAYSPDEVELYLIDFKEGVEFKAYAEAHLPHARVIAIESEREFGISVLEGLSTELEHRGDLFRGARCNDLADFRAVTGQPLPRILLLVDEFHEFFSEDDAIAQQARLILDRLVRQGRAFGIHVILGSQSLAGAYTMARNTVDQMAVRIALQCSDADSRLILSDDNNAAQLLTRPGEAIYNAANGLIEGNVRFQIAWLPEEERNHLLAQVRALADRMSGASARTQVVFEGDELALLANNHDLTAELAGVTSKGSPLVSPAWLGEPVAICKQHTAALLRRQSRANLLLLGQDEEAAAGMMSAALLGLAARHRGARCSFYLLDLAGIGGPAHGALARVADALPQPVRLARRRREISGLIAEVAEQVVARQALEVDESPGDPIYLAIFGLQSAHELRRDDDMRFSYSSEPVPESSAVQFATLLRDGPEVGVHTLVYCSTLASLERTLDRRGLAEFGLRVALPMAAEQSVQLIDSPVASKLASRRAYLYDEDQPGRLEKFRPYALPDAKWLQAAATALRCAPEVTNG